METTKGLGVYLGIAARSIVMIRHAQLLFLRVWVLGSRV